MSSGHPREDASTLQRPLLLLADVHAARNERPVSALLAGYCAYKIGNTSIATSASMSCTLTIAVVMLRKGWD